MGTKHFAPVESLPYVFQKNSVNPHSTVVRFDRVGLHAQWELRVPIYMPYIWVRRCFMNHIWARTVSWLEFRWWTVRCTAKVAPGNPYVFSVGETGLQGATFTVRRFQSQVCFMTNYYVAKARKSQTQSQQYRLVAQQQRKIIIQKFICCSL